MNSRIPRSDEALAHLGWIRALALSLVRDESAADDIVQDAYLLSLERPPRLASRLGPWLAQVTRTLARQSARGNRSRRERESIATRDAGPKEAPEPSEVLERGRRQRAVVDAVMALPEPYAATVLHHYLDGLSTTEIAREMECPATTVRKRLERARGLLRDTLDREFDCETKSWAIALALPFASQRPVALATVATATSATTLVATGLMGSKVIGWIGLAVACVLFGIVQVLGGGEDPETPALDTHGVVTVSETNPGTHEVAEVAAPESARERLAVVPHVEALAEPSGVATVRLPNDFDGGTELVVRGLTSAGVPVTAGQVDCFWSSMERLPDPSRQEHLSAPIKESVTRIRLPSEARSVRVCISHLSFAPSPGVTLDQLRRGPDGEDLVGVPERKVDVTLLAPNSKTNSRLVYGDIYIDEVRQCPPGLRVFANGTGYASINVLTSRYQVEAQTSLPDKLQIVSDFTIPTYQSLAELTTDQSRVDLKLESGHDLRVYAVDATTGAPAVGRDISISMFNTVEKSFATNKGQGHSQTQRVDGSGFCHFQGIPLKGVVDVTQILDDGIGKRSLLRVDLAAEKKKLIECEVSIGSSATVITRVFGKVSDDPGGVVQGVRTILAKSWSGGGSKTTPIDANGDWSIELNSHQAWDVQARRDGRVASFGEFVELKGETEHGPVALFWHGAQKVTLRIIDVPPSGRIAIECKDLEGGANLSLRLDAKGIDLTRELELAGPTEVSVSVRPIDGDSEFGIRRTLKIYPASQREAVVDLRGSRTVTATFKIDGEHPVGEAHLILAAPGDPSARIHIPMRDGKTIEPQVVDPGQWFYFYQHADYPGAVIGIVKIDHQREMELSWTGALLESSQLGDALKLLRLDGVDMQAWFPQLTTLPWMKEQLGQARLWIPASLEYEVVE